MTALGLILLAVGILTLVIVIRTGSPRQFVFTPLLLFAINEGMRVWPSAVHARLTGISTDGYVIMVATLGLWGFLLGYALFMGWSTERRRLPEGFRAAPLEAPERSAQHYYIGILIMGIMLIGAGLVLYRGIPPIGQAIQSIITDDGQQQDVALFMGAARADITKSHYFGGEYRGQGALRALMAIGWAYILGYALLLAYRFRSPGSYTVASLMGLFTLLFVAGDGTRAPVGNVIVYLVVLLSLLVGVRFKTAIIGFFAVVTVIGSISYLTPKAGHVFEEDESLITSSITAIGERVALGNGINNVHAIEFLRRGRIASRGGGEHLRKFAAAIPGIEPGPPLGYELHLLLHPHSRKTTYQSTTYLAIIYVDFGLPGVAIIYLLMGMVVGLAQARLLRMRKRIETLPLLAYVSAALGLLPLVGFSGLVSISVVLVVVHLGMRFALYVAGLFLNPRGRARRVEGYSRARP